MKIRQKKGIVLITTMLLLTIIIMLVTLMTLSANQGLRLGVAYSDGEQAHYAALSGLEYARSRIYDNSTWMQGAESNSYTLGDVSVSEENQLVTGNFYSSKDNSNLKSQFFIAFSEESALSAGVNYTSVNNIGGSKTLIYKKDEGVFKRYKDVDGNRVYLVVKGVSNNVVRYAEAYITPSGVNSFDSPTVARGDIDVSMLGANSQMIVNSSSLANKQASIRTKENILFSSPSKNTDIFIVEDKAHASNVIAKYNKLENKKWKKFEETLEVSGNDYGISIDNSEDSKKLTETILNSSGNVFNWDSLTENTKMSQDKSIAYIYDLKSQAWKCFEDVSVDGAYKERIKGTEIQMKNLDGLSFSTYSSTNSEDVKKGEPFVKVNKKVQYGGNLYIGVVADSSALSKKGYMSHSATERAYVFFDNSVELPSLEIGNTSFLPDGEESNSNLIIQGEVAGQGKIITKGDIYIQGGSFLDTVKNSGVSIYAENDVRVLPSTNYRFSQKYNNIISELGSLWENLDWDGKEMTQEQAIAELLKQNDFIDVLKNNKITEDDYESVAEIIVLKNTIMSSNTSSSEQLNLSSPFVATEESTWNSGKYKLEVSLKTDSSFEMLSKFECDGDSKILNSSTNSIYSGSFFEFHLSNMEDSHDNLFLYVPIVTSDTPISPAPGTLPSGVAYLKLQSANAQSTMYSLPLGRENAYVDLQNIYHFDLQEIFSKYNDAVKTNTVIETNVIKDAFVFYPGTAPSKVEEYSDEFVQKYSAMLDALKDINATGQNNSIVKNFALKVYLGDEDGTSMQKVKVGLYNGANNSTSEELNTKNFLRKVSTLESMPKVSNDILINGFIYSRNGIFEVDSDEGGIVKINGGVIAAGMDGSSKGGIIKIKNTLAAHFCYDPDYMSFFYQGDKIITNYIYRYVF